MSKEEDKFYVDAIYDFEKNLSNNEKIELNLNAPKEPNDLRHFIQEVLQQYVKSDDIDKFKTLT